MSDTAAASQCAAILSALKQGRALTPLDALQEFGCMRLAARIKNLRDRGIPVATEWETDGEKRWAKYRIL